MKVKVGRLIAAGTALAMGVWLPSPAMGARPPSAQFVKRSGTQLVLGGAPYRFTGFNIYNANSVDNCWYTMGNGPLLDEALSAQSPGNEAIRAWFFQSLATVDGARSWSAFDHTLSVAKAHGYRVIVTLGNQWGDCEGSGTPEERFKNEDWYSNGYKLPDPAGIVSYRDWVREVVARYKADPTVLMWQLLNEAEVKPSLSSGCSVGGAGILRAFADDVGKMIKRLDRNHLLSLGTIGGGQCATQSDEYSFVHASPQIDLCEFHDYEPNAPMPGDQWNGLAVRISQCGALNKPIFIGETGIRPSDLIGGQTLDDRAAAFRAKLDVQFPAGAVGLLAWAWSALGSTLDNYDIGSGDPAIAVLGDSAYS